jgi:hypothetical protein
VSPARAFALATLAVSFLSLLFLNAPHAASDVVARPGVAVVVIEDRISFEELMGVPAFRNLAGSGGAALMATDQTYRSRMNDVYLALGAGANPRSAVPHLLERTLAGHGVALCAAQDASGSLPPGPDLSLGIPRSQNCDAAAGSRSALVVVSDLSLLRLDDESSHLTPALVSARRRTLLEQEGDVPGALLATIPGQSRALLMVVTPSPSSSMTRVGDEVTPLVMAEGPANEVLTPAGPIQALTSDTTRRDGLVANVDVAPTILQFFGIPIPSEMDGQPIRRDGHVDLFALHRLHLEQRHIRLPIQLGELGFVSLLGIIGIPLLVALAVRGSLPTRVAATMRYATLCGAAFGIVLLAGGLLPRLTWSLVIPYVVVATAALATVSLVWRRRDPMAPFAFLGVVGVVFIVVEGLLGGRAFAVPLLGGTMFDGVRFYGLPNAFISILLGSALLTAAMLEPVPGFLVLFGMGLFAGLPPMGADIGGSITLFAAAGLWWALRMGPSRRRPADQRGWPLIRMAVALGVTILVGLAIVLLANRYLPGAPTHATRFVERSTTRLGSAFSEIRHRSGVGWRMLNAVPAAYIPLFGLAVVLGLAIAGPGPIGRGLALVPIWRDALVAMVIAAAVAFFANDTGVAASAPAFLYAASLIAYTALLPAAWARPPPGDRPPVPARQPQEIS